MGLNGDLIQEHLTKKMDKFECINLREDRP
jgi:hypothetical protein